MRKLLIFLLLMLLIGACKENYLEPPVVVQTMDKIEKPKFDLGKIIPVTNNIVTTEFDFPRDKNWREAQIACDSLNKEKLQGINTWRVPTIQELKMLYQASTEKKITNFVYEESSKYWVYWSTTLPPGPDSLYWAQVIDFKKGPKEEVITVASQEGKYHFRPISTKK